MVYGIYPRCYEAEPSNPEGITYTTASEESMWLVPQLTAFHQSQFEKSIPLCNSFGFRQLREQRLEKCGLCPITLHFSRPLIGGRQATVVQTLIANITRFANLKSQVKYKCVVAGRSFRRRWSRGWQVTISDNDETSLMCAFMFKKVA